MIGDLTVEGGGFIVIIEAKPKHAAATAEDMEEWPILVVFKHFRNPQHPYDPICIEIDEPEPVRLCKAVPVADVGIINSMDIAIPAKH